MSAQPEFTRDFVGLLTDHQAALRAFVLSLMPGLPNVQDVLQETNLTLWEKRKTFRSGTNFRAWAFTVARFTVMQHYRKLKRDGWLIFNEELTERLKEAAPETFQPEEVEQRYQALEKCLQRLKPIQQELIQHRYTHRGSLEDYARTIGRTDGSLRVTLYRIRAALRRCMHHQLSSPGPNA